MNPANSGLFSSNSPNLVPIQASVPNFDMKMETMDGMGTFNSPTAWKPFNKRPRPADAKVPADVKRRRKNYRAKKLLVPKNPLMILNELKPGTPFTISDTLSDNNQIGFTATVEIDGITFSGQGPSKKQAQAEAAEAALRGIYFDKVLDQLLLKKEDEDCHMSSPNQDDDCEGDGTLKSSFPEDDTPWSGLASLAMYKLVNAWQTPSPTNACRSQQPQVPSSQLKAKLPANASEMDPVMLLNQISPHSKFVEMSRDIRDCAAIFTMAVDFNGSSFSGSATKKEDSQKTLC